MLVVHSLKINKFKEFTNKEKQMQPTLPTKEALSRVLSEKKMACARRYVNKESERISLIKDQSMLSTAAISGDRCLFLKNLDEREIVLLLKEEYDTCLSYNQASAKKKTAIISGAAVGIGPGIIVGTLVGILLPPVGVAIIGGTVAGSVTAGGMGAITGRTVYVLNRQAMVDGKIIKHDDDRYKRIRLKINEIELKITEYRNDNLNQDADQLKVASIYFQSVAEIYLLSRNTLNVVHS